MRVTCPQQQSGGSTITSHEAAFGRVSARRTRRAEQPWFSHQESAGMVPRSLHIAKVQRNLGNLCALKASACPKTELCNLISTSQVKLPELKYKNASIYELNAFPKN